MGAPTQWPHAAGTRGTHRAHGARARNVPPIPAVENGACACACCRVHPTGTRECTDTHMHTTPRIYKHDPDPEETHLKTPSWKVLSCNTLSNKSRTAPQPPYLWQALKAP